MIKELRMRTVEAMCLPGMQGGKVGVGWGQGQALPNLEDEMLCATKEYVERVNRVRMALEKGVADLKADLRLAQDDAACVEAELQRVSGEWHAAGAETQKFMDWLSETLISKIDAAKAREAGLAKERDAAQARVADLLEEMRMITHAAQAREMELVKGVAHLEAERDDALSQLAKLWEEVRESDARGNSGGIKRTRPNELREEDARCHQDTQR